MKVAQSCPTLWDPVDYTVHGILQARILEWVAFPFSRGSSQPRDRTQVSRIAGGVFTSWAIKLITRLKPRVSDSLGLGVGPENLHFCLVPRWCWGCWSRSHTLRTTHVPILFNFKILKYSFLKFLIYFFYLDAYFRVFETYATSVKHMWLVKCRVVNWCW